MKAASGREAFIAELVPIFYSGNFLTGKTMLIHHLTFRIHQSRFMSLQLVVDAVLGYATGPLRPFLLDLGQGLSDPSANTADGSFGRRKKGEHLEYVDHVFIELVRNFDSGQCRFMRQQGDFIPQNL